MRRLRPFLALLLVALVASWGEGLCGPAAWGSGADAAEAPPCHGTAPTDAAPDAHRHGGPTDSEPGRGPCAVCPLCVPVAAPFAVAGVRMAGPRAEPPAFAASPAQRPAQRPPVPPPRPVA